MATKKYYIERPKVRVHNKKTAALAELLKRYDNALIEFGEDGDITLQTMLRWLKNYLMEINQSYTGRDITVRMYDFNDHAGFSFHDNPNSGEATAEITLKPVSRIIDDEELL